MCVPSKACVMNPTETLSVNHTLLWRVLIATSAGTFCWSVTVMIGLTCVHLRRGHRVGDLGLFQSFSKRVSVRACV